MDCVPAEDYEQGDTFCRWKDCDCVARKGSAFCPIHGKAPPVGTLPDWVRSLPYAIGTGLATNLLWEMLEIFAKNVLFSDPTAEKVTGMQARLRSEAIADQAIEEVARFMEIHHQDLGFYRDAEEALRTSGQFLEEC